ncbi:MAG: helix-turn-helix transcriptional regulator [Desulfobacterales bacterium]|jgi:transcriptional regulator with XRE-family HTH domain
MINPIGERVKYLRLILGFQQEDLANILFIQRGYVSQIETNKQQPSDSLIALIAEKFDVSEDWLRKGEDPMRTEFNQRIKKEKARYALETGIGLETVGKRIRFARTYKEVDPTVITSMLITTKEDYLYSLESGKKQATEHDIEVIAKYVDASKEWLLTGSGKIGFLEMGGLLSPREEPEGQDEELNDIIQGIKLFWKQSKEDVRTWFKVQLRLMFSEIEECQKKHAEIQDENAVTGDFPEVAEEIKKGDDESGGTNTNSNK